MYRSEERTGRRDYFLGNATNILWERKQPLGSMSGSKCTKRHLLILEFMDLEYLQTERLRIFPNPDGMGCECTESVKGGGMEKQGHKEGLST